MSFQYLHLRIQNFNFPKFNPKITTELVKCDTPNTFQRRHFFAYQGDRYAGMIGDCSQINRSNLTFNNPELIKTLADPETLKLGFNNLPINTPPISDINFDSLSQELTNGSFDFSKNDVNSQIVSKSMDLTLLSVFDYAVPPYEYGYARHIGSMRTKDYPKKKTASASIFYCLGSLTGNFSNSNFLKIIQNNKRITCTLFLKYLENAMTHHYFSNNFHFKNHILSEFDRLVRLKIDLTVRIKIQPLIEVGLFTKKTRISISRYDETTILAVICTNNHDTVSSNLPKEIQDFFHKKLDLHLEWDLF